MGQILEAIYENGVLRPLKEPPGLVESQKVRLVLLDPPGNNVDEYLELCHSVYEGLSDEDVADVESIALDRSHFRTRDIDV